MLCTIKKFPWLTSSLIVFCIEIILFLATIESNHYCNMTVGWWNLFPCLSFDFAINQQHELWAWSSTGVQWLANGLSVDGSWLASCE